jgi:preprotein translocase subunit SecD
MYFKRTLEKIGKFIKSPTHEINFNGVFETSITMTNEGTIIFAAITKANIIRPLTIVLDGKLCSATVIGSEIIEGRARFSGSGSQRDAIEQSNVLNNPLECEPKLSEMVETG